MAVDSVPSATANSYISNADAIAVWEADPYKQDYATVITDQDVALIASTTMLDDIYGASYDGKLYDASYSLYWPRTGVIDNRTGVLITDYTSYPTDLARATALQAYHISKTDRQTESADQVSAVKREKVDVIEVEYQTTSEQKQANYRTVIHPEVERIMSKFVSGSASGFTNVMYR